MFLISGYKSLLGYELLNEYPGILHFTTTRYGGCGSGNYATFNITPYTGDRPETVAKNKTHLCELLDIPEKSLVLPWQSHTTNVFAIDKSFLFLPEEKQRILLQDVDALVTNVPGVCICVSTADCIPVMIYDPIEKVIAIVHAGWKGTVGRIVAKTICEVQKKYGVKPENLITGIGPGISVNAFEVGNEVYERFRQEGFDMDKIAVYYPEKEKYHIDLWECNRIQLIDTGVDPDNIQLSGICTYERYEDFFSARRLGIDSGRILSGIMLKNIN